MPDRRRPLTSEELVRLAQAIDPAARVVGSVPLLGGLDWGTYRIDLQTLSGRPSYVVRRFDGEGDRPAASARRLWTVLSALRHVDLPVPRPILLDEGPLIGVPVLVMTLCEGGVVRPPAAEPAAWIEAYAGALAAIHDAHMAPVPGISRCTGQEAELERLAGRPAEGDLRATWEDVVAALRLHVVAVRAVDPVLRHGDVWFGNTLWRDDRVTGLLDWGEACVGDPREDLGYARLDLHLVLGAEAAAAFRRAYERRRDVMPDLAYFDLLAAARGLVWLSGWVDGYHEVGLTELSLTLARARLLAFVSDAMSRLGSHSRDERPIRLGS